MSLAADITAEGDSERLRATIRSLLRQLEAAKASRTELVQAVRDAATQAAQALTLPPVPAPPRERRHRPGHTAILLLADWQLAKTTPSYNTDVCEKRITTLMRRTAEIIEAYRAHHPVTAARVYLLGDLIEGEMIFPGQAHRVDASLYRQVLVDGPRILGATLRHLATLVPAVRVVGVIGNHGSLGGRARRDYHPESNADAMMYEATRLTLAGEQRITWAPNMTAGERHWYALDTIGGRTWLLFHGDQVKGGFAGFPWYGFSKRILGWHAGAVPARFDYAAAGHFHTPTRMTIGPVTLWVSGSTESHNTYAAEQLAAQGQPSQWLLFADELGQVTAEHQVTLGE